MKSFLSSAALAAVILASPGSEAFAPSSQRAALVAPSAQAQRPSTFGIASSQYSTHLYASKDDESESSPNNDIANDETPPRRRLRSAISAAKRKSKPLTLALLAATTLRLADAPGFHLVQPAGASAPIVLKAAMKKDDPPMVNAMKKAKELKKKKSTEAFDVFMKKANDIEDEQGKKARAAYEKQYKIDKEAAEAALVIEVEELKRTLLDAGQDPHTERDAEHRVWKLEHDLDLDKVSGTPQNEYMIRAFKKRGKKGKKGSSLDGGATQAEVHQRYIIACQVADLKARGIDPLERFSQSETIDKTRVVYKMDEKIAAKVAGQYEVLMEKYGGRLTPAAEGEVPFVYTSAAAQAEADTVSIDDGPNAKMERRAKRAAEKEAATVARRAARAERAAEKAAGKESRAAEKAAAAAGVLAAKEAATAAAAAGASAAGSLVDEDLAATMTADVSAVAESSIEQTTATEVTTQQTDSTSSSKVNDILSQVKTYATPANAATVVIGGGAAVYGFNYFSENSGSAQAERERQLKLILGDDEDDDNVEEDDDDDDDDDDFENFTARKTPTPPKSEPKADAPKPTPKPTPPPPVPAPKPKRKLGIFAKRNANARETDINALVTPSAQAPEFASLLAKILTFGAPGRFPGVAAWGSMPFDKFDLEEAKSLLTESRGDADLADEQSAEIFAAVVNCMIIDIVDLASSTLKVKDAEDKLTVDAINVVMDFMDHAASLFDAVAKDVTIKPVTYGGTIRKKDLEQMFSIYGGGSMMSMDGSVTQDRVDTLQLVFAIPDKKAEGLMQKHMMKMMMNLMKDGGKGMEGMPGMEGMEGMEEMMKAMGGEGGMPGMEGMEGMPGMDGGEMSPEDLKQTLGMMKDLMDSGQVSEEELKEVRGQFKEMYGEDISDLVNKASAEGGENMTDDERELMDMFKRILGDDIN